MTTLRRAQLDHTTVGPPLELEPGYPPAGRAPAGRPAPPAWQGMGGELDTESSRACRGTVYQRRSRTPWMVRLLLLVLIVASTAAGVYAVLR